MTRRQFLRWVGAVLLPLAFLASALLSLWVGMVLGTKFVRTGASIMEAALIPEELRRNADDLVSVIPLTLAVLAAMHGGLPTVLARFTTGVWQFLKECWKLPSGRHSWLGESSKPSEPARLGLVRSFLEPIPHMVVAAFLFSSFGATLTEPSRPPVVYVSPDSMLSVLPIHPLVHFENAVVDRVGELTKRGITLQDARRTALKEDVEALRPCAAPDRPITIRPYGFASNDPFQIPGVDRAESDRLNVDAANRRSRAVYDALTELIEETELSMAVEEPFEWKTFEEMKDERNSMIRVPEGVDRDPFTDRVVVLHLMSLGACRAVDPPAPSTATEPPILTDPPPSAAPTTSRSDFPVENAAITGAEGPHP